VQLELGVVETLVARVFAVVIFVSDGLLQVRKSNDLQAKSGAERFILTATRLPMELQMILCHRVYGSMRDNVRIRESEPAFRHLAKELV